MSVRVLIRGSDLKLRGEIDDYTSLTVVPRLNAVGRWVMELNAGSTKALLLDPKAGSANPGGGIVVMRNGQTVLSGPIRTFGWRKSGESNREGSLVISGPDDNIELSSRAVWPVPLSAIGSQTSPFYQASGASTPIETLMRTLVDQNAGPTSPHASRRIPLLSLPASLGRGTATGYRGKFRFDPLISALAEMAQAAPSGIASPLNRGGLGFRLVQVGTNLQFQVYAPADRRASAKFSFELGNLVDASYDVEAPSTTVAILGAGRNAAFTNGPTVASNLATYTRTDTYFPSVYAETFVDVGEINPADADYLTQLQEASDQHFDSASGQIGLSIKPVDTASLTYGQHWTIGDFVTVATPYLTLQEQVREAQVTYTADEGERIEAIVGTVDGAFKRRTPGFIRRFLAVKKVISKTEARK